MTLRHFRRATGFATLLLFSACSHAQPTKAVQPGPMLADGTVTLHSPALSLTLVRSSGTVAALSVANDPGFDFSPSDRLKERSMDTFYHLGDLDLRVRLQGQTAWSEFDTAYRRKPLKVLQQDDTHYTTDLAETLPAEIPLQITRTWQVSPDGLRLTFTLRNTAASPLELGGLGIPMVFNNDMNERTLEQAYTTCSFFDPYIGQDAGYVQVVRLRGTGPVLLVVPDGKTPLEGWKPILDHRRKDGSAELGNDPTPRGMTFEGFYDWMVHTQAFAETDWKQTTGSLPQQWNQPTERVLQPGEQITYGVRFLVAPAVRSIEDTLGAAGRPVAVGLPGYILPQDTPARLFLRSNSAVTSLVTEPADAATVHDDGPAQDTAWHGYTLRGTAWGPFRLRVTYADGTVQTIAYRVIKPEADAVADMGRFLFHQQWYDDPSDPFHRGPSIMSYDDAAGHVLTQDSRVWIAGLSDEAGAGSYIAAAMKQVVSPQPEEVAKLEQFANQTLWGRIQVPDGDTKYGVHKSVFFYDPAALPKGYYDPSLNWKTWTSWDQKGAADIGRTFNYPHVAAAWWALYHVARNTRGLTHQHPWQWYLEQSYQTTMAMRQRAPYYLQFGLMEGTLFQRLLRDLRSEGWNEKADQLEAFMKERAQHWQTEAFPFGSEMPWDSTGQEEVYDWTRYFGMDSKAETTLNAILAYTPVVPSWGYNGSSRRFWDFLYGGKYPRIERQLHHYGSGLNAIPLLAEYRLHPDDLYLLRAGYGGVQGPLTNIDQKGFASAAFHSFPDRMAFDPYTGDYGPNFLGHALNTGTYLVHDPHFGWLAFGGLVTQQHDSVRVVPTDSARARVFVAPLSLWIELESGTIASVDYLPARQQAVLHLAASAASTGAIRLRLEDTTRKQAKLVVQGAAKTGDIYTATLKHGTATLTVQNESTQAK